MAWIAERVRLSEEAYYALDFEAAAEALSDDRWTEALDAVVDMALDPELAENIRRGLMALGRTYYYGRELAEADGAILKTLYRFPEWVPTTRRYQPEFVEHFAEVRSDFLPATVPLTIETPDEGCVVALNGIDVRAGRTVTVAVPNGTYAIRVRCALEQSRVHRIDVSGEGSIRVDPAFDALFDPGRTVLALDPGPSEDFSTLARDARAFADVVGVSRTIVVGVTSNDQLLLVDVGADGSEVPAAVRADRPAEADFPVDAAVEALLSGEPAPGVAVAGEGDWLVAGSGDSDGGGFGPAPWISFGVAGAGLATGLAFLVVESSRFDEFEACRDDEVCADGPDLDDRRTSAERAGVAATVGFGVAIAGAVTGAVLLAVLAGRRDRAPEGTAEARAWIPLVGGGPAPDGGGIALHWSF